MSTPPPPRRRRGHQKADPEAVGKLTAPRKRLAPAAVINPVTGKVAGAKRGKVKLTSWMDEEDAAEVRGTYLGTRDRTGYRSLTAMINAAVMAEVRRLQAEHHRGKPYPPAKPGDVPTGRPL
jgi:hypothetical protein